MPNAHRVQSRIVKQVLTTLGAEIERGRKARKFSQADLADRIGCSRNTLRAVEAGKPSVEIGIVLEAAALVGVPLLGGDLSEIARRGDLARREAALLPQPRPSTEIDDDF